MSVHKFDVYADSGPIQMTIQYLDELGMPAKAVVRASVKKKHPTHPGGTLHVYVSDAVVVPVSSKDDVPTLACPHCGKRYGDPAANRMDGDPSQWK